MSVAFTHSEIKYHAAKYLNFDFDWVVIYICLGISIVCHAHHRSDFIPGNCHLVILHHWPKSLGFSSH